MITIKKIAQMLGTSTTTVSNVIHGKTSEVSPAMIEKVQKLIDEYNYVPNINARNLANNKSRIIGIVMKYKRDKCENFIKDPFGGELTGALESFVKAKGYFTMLYISDDIMEIIHSVSSWNVDGLILQGVQKEDAVFLKNKVKKPMVFIDCYFEELIMDYVNVGIQDRKGSYEITKYLIQNGHRKIAYLADNCVNVDYERFKGYKDALYEAGIPYNENNFIMLFPNRGDLTFMLADVYRRAKDFTALVCDSDYYAVHIMNYFTDRGIKVPKDISIVGFDDNVYSKIARPALTTVHQDVSKKSEIAVDKLFKMINKEDVGERLTYLPVKVIKRDTVRNLQSK